MTSLAQPLQVRRIIAATARLRHDVINID